MKWALLSNGVVDTVSFEDHSQVNGWIEVDDEVFGGDIEQSDGSFEHPTPIPTFPSQYRISKSTPWLRMTDDEAELITGAMQQASARLKGIYDAASYLSTDDPLWATLHDMIAATLGSTSRADALLAPET